MFNVKIIQQTKISHPVLTRKIKFEILYFDTLHLRTKKWLIYNESHF
jgi:hypothetical protein